MISLEILLRSFNTNILFQKNFRKTDSQKHTTQKTLGSQTTVAALLFIETNLRLILYDTNTHKHLPLYNHDIDNTLYSLHQLFPQ